MSHFRLLTLLPALALSVFALSLTLACSEEPSQPGGGAATGGTGGDGGGTGGTGGVAGQGGTGGDPGCTGHAQCTEAALAQCEAGSCVPCTEHEHCAGVTALGVCEAGTCVQCALADDSACTASQTCNLLTFSCVDVAPGTVLSCLACSNDAQCATDHRCIPMDFEGSAHGHYCLREPPPTCERPFFVPITRASLNGAPSTTYCGINEELATCEAVLALLDDWRCPSGIDGMCGPPPAEPEVAVPGAICRPILGADRCTYACAGPQQCPDVVPADTCGSTGAGGSGGTANTDWCGG